MGIRLLTVICRCLCDADMPRMNIPRWIAAPGRMESRWALGRWRWGGRFWIWPARIIGRLPRRKQTAEVLKLSKPVDGLFFDMCWDQPSAGNYAVEAMLKRNLNPEIEADRDKIRPRGFNPIHEAAFAGMVRAKCTIRGDGLF